MSATHVRNGLRITQATERLEPRSSGLGRVRGDCGVDTGFSVQFTSPNRQGHGLPGGPRPDRRRKYRRWYPTTPQVPLRTAWNGGPNQRKGYVLRKGPPLVEGTKGEAGARPTVKLENHDCAFGCWGPSENVCTPLRPPTQLYLCRSTFMHMKGPMCPPSPTS
ncbi:unnamed protein product [Gadus morhua 'NCC']